MYNMRYLVNIFLVAALMEDIIGDLLVFALTPLSNEVPSITLTVSESATEAQLVRVEWVLLKGMNGVYIYSIDERRAVRRMELCNLSSTEAITLTSSTQL
ncbi:MAG: hypothetical protein DRN55_01575 [Thermoplasmata archaeon]|nr:MAG: hypothetical protein DRN55_01575 [Thermoplasmata archaeon]